MRWACTLHDTLDLDARLPLLISYINFGIDRRKGLCVSFLVAYFPTASRGALGFSNRVVDSRAASLAVLDSSAGYRRWIMSYLADVQLHRG